ncbi:MAG: cyclic nucleotide-binding domain-containing protein, partial [Leptospiraceae bacterium]|nr:cyclic nucleotide-binding domain-containing protein [Leptospiraceae bacterium]
LYRESRALSVKDQQGREVPVDAFVRFYDFNNEELNTEHFRLKHVNHNVYEIEGTIIDVNFSEEQFPPYDLKPDFVPMMPARYSIDVLGGASGFAANNPCSGLALNYHSDFMLIDCMPYLEYALNARGISREQVKSLFLTHIHDDHCNIFPLVLFNNRVRFLATREIFWMACKKLSLMTGHPISEFESYFDFVELIPYERNEFYGLTITPHYTVHSIPTIGASFEMSYDGRNRRIVFVGDNKSLTDIQDMVAKGDVSQKKFEYLQNLYHDRHDLFFADGGMGILHGNPRDSLKSRSDRVIFLHLEKLPREFDTTFTLASHGKRFILNEAREESYIVKTMQILMRHYPGLSEEWENTLLSNLRLAKYNTGDIIMKQGEPRNGIIYVILTGNVSVLHHDGEELREVGVKEAGEIIGDMAVVNNVSHRNASIVARIPVTLCEIEEELFYTFLQAENRVGDLKEMWQKRSELETHFPFCELGDVVNSRLAHVGNRENVPADTMIIEQGGSGRDFYIILSGRFSILRDGKQINVIGPGSMFGEYGSLAERVRNASVQSLDDAVVLRLRKEEITRIIDSSPALNFHVHQLFKDRDELVEA